MMDDQYSFPYAEHPSYSPPPDYHAPGSIDYHSETPESPMAAPAQQPFGAAILGETGYDFLRSFVAWFNAVRSS